MISSPVKISILTLSDRASRGEYDDLSGPQIEELVLAFFVTEPVEILVDTKLIPDDPEMLRLQIIEAQAHGSHFLITTGGTGIGPRDFTPDIVREFLTKEIPGIMEMIRVKYGMIKPNALVSRSVAGVYDQMIIYSLPGSVKAVREYMKEILPTMMHSLKMVHGVDDHR